MKAFMSQEDKEAVLDYYNMLLGKLTVPYEELKIVEFLEKENT